MRYWLFQGAKSAAVHTDEFKLLHEYYTTRNENPLKKMQSLIVVVCKLLRVIFTILRTGRRYDPGKMMKDIKQVFRWNLSLWRICSTWYTGCIRIVIPATGVRRLSYIMRSCVLD